MPPIYFLDDPENSDPAGSEIPNAVGETLGLSVHDLRSFFGALRWRYFSDSPLIEDNSVRWDSSSLVNATLGYRFKNGLSLALEVFNLLDNDDSEIQYFYTSRLPGEPADGVKDIHSTRSSPVRLAW